ncbi:MAG: hypothetical protein ACE5FF_02460 [Saprospiraceae bacterium]
MRHLVIAFSILLFSVACNAQSFLGVTIGTDFARVKESDYNHSVKVKENGYSPSSFVLGIVGEHQLTKSFTVTARMTYTKKNVNADVLGIIIDFADFTGIEFNYFHSSFIGKWYLMEKWYFGAGVSLNYLSNVKDQYTGVNTEKDKHFETPSTYFRNNKKEYGGLLSTGIRYKNFLLDLYYNKSFTPPRKDLDDFKPINSFGISLSYLIRVSKSKRK